MDEQQQVTIPSVWRSDGHVYLAYRQRPRKGSIIMVTFQESPKEVAVERVLASMHRMPESESPIYFALLLVAKKAQGFQDLPLSHERTLVMMMTKEELMKLSERKLAHAYAELMGTTVGRIASSAKEKYIDAMLAKMQQTTEAAPPEPALDTTPLCEGIIGISDPRLKDENMATAKKAAAKKAPAKKEAPAKKAAKKEAPVKKEAAEKKPRAPKAPSERKVIKDESGAIVNQYRDGSIKARAFDIFVKAGGDMEKFMKAADKLECQVSTLRSWASDFRVRSGL